MAVVVATLVLSGLAAAAGGDGDIICTSTKQKFTLPAACLAASCAQGMRMGFCQLAPQSPCLAHFAFQGGKPTNLAMLYDDNVLHNVLLERAPTDEAMDLAESAACEFVLTMFTPYRCEKDFTRITVTPPNFYLRFDCMLEKGSKNKLEFTVDLFKKSPGSSGANDRP